MQEVKEEMNEDQIIQLQALMNEKQEQILKLRTEWSLLNSARQIYQDSARQHHQFDDREEMEEAMLSNFNPFDTFSLRNEPENSSK